MLMVVSILMAVILIAIPTKTYLNSKIMVVSGVRVLREDFGTDGLAFSAGVPHQLFFTLLKLHAVAHDLGLGFRVQGFRVQGFRVYGLGFRVQGSGVSGLGMEDACLLLRQAPSISSSCTLKTVRVDPKTLEPNLRTPSGSRDTKLYLGLTSPKSLNQSSTQPKASILRNCDLCMTSTHAVESRILLETK